MSAPEADCEVAIVGAGPAGLAAASLCARAGLATALFDEGARPGGRIYRDITRTPLDDRSILGADYWSGARLVEEFAASGARYFPNTTVWSVTPELELGVSTSGSASLVHARSVILAPGALERPFPFPGWTLPGVMTAGAAQTLLKSSAIVPQGRIVLAGTGPLLWLLASQYLAAGVFPEAILDTTPHENRARALAGLAGFIVSPYLLRGLRVLLSVRGKIPVVPHVTELRAEGTGRVDRVTYRTAEGAGRTLPADALVLHQGVVPDTHLAMAAGAEHRWDEAQLCLRPVVDSHGGTSVRGLLVAGDAAGIGGAQAAAWRGVVSAIAVVRAIHPGKEMPVEKIARAALARFSRGRRFLDNLYRPPEAFRIPSNDTIVCRCEEVTAEEVRDAIALGCTGPNQVKAFTRCGMGPCQGRMCALTVTELVARARGTSAQDAGTFRIRPPVKPVTVGEIASLPKSEAAVRAVVRS